MSTTTTKRATAGANIQPQTAKKYACKRCGHVVQQVTNHYGPTWSAGHYNTCPNCPPWAKYSEFGGSTEWECLERPPTIKAETDMSPEHDAGLADAARIAELEAEGLTHSDAVGVMEAEKLARQPEPAAGEERGDLQLTYEVYDGKHGLFEGNLLVAVVGECVARSEQTRVLAQTIKTRVNSHTQLVAALEQAHELVYVGVSDRKMLSRSNLYRVVDTIADALRLAKDGE